MDTRTVYLKHLNHLVQLLMTLDADHENFPELDNSKMIDATENLLIETVDRLFKRVPSFPMPGAK